MISFSLNHPKEKSVAIFGRAPASYYRGYPTYLSANQNYKQWWTVDLKNVFYNDKSVHTSGVNHAIISTGTPYIYMVKSDFLNFKDALYASWENSTNVIACPKYAIFGQICYSDYPCDSFKEYLAPLSFYLGDKTYTIPPEGYLLDDFLTYKCAIAISWI